MSSRLRAPFVAVLTAVALTGCSDGDGGGFARQDPVAADALLKQVRPGGAGPQEIDTRVAARLEGDARGTVALFVDTPLELRVTGRGDTASRKADLRVEIDAGVLKADGRFLGDGTRDYAQVRDAWYVLPDTGTGVLTAVMPALLERPDALLADGAQVIGTEAVEGVECDVVDGRADADAVARRLGGVIDAVPVPGGGAGPAAAALRAAVQGGTARVWIGRDDKAVHRVRVVTPVDLSATSLGAQGVTVGEVTLDGLAVDADGPVEVETPADARPIGDLQAELGSLIPQGSG